ncbi:ABC transporter substrate-binding protein [Devosia sp. A16]|uniref:ABC transporter substrate-binding protein n=1 Tax=Devosia sp. A16 TaxID=1736675 RepID=UPI0006D820B6|nr:ABC transporter substrate-binding protein [Devosia sp. A16]
MLRRTFFAVAIATLSALVGTAVAEAQAFTVTDVAGREVSFEKPVERVILGEGRQIYFVSVLDTEDPFKRVVGWRDDVRTADLDTWNEYLAKFPAMSDIPVFGNLTDGTFQTELAVSLKPDVLLLPLESRTPAEESKLFDTLDSIGVKVVFIDFRLEAFKNTEASMTILGQLFGKEQRAAEFNAFRTAQIKRVTDVIEAKKPTEPLVFLERAPGFFDECCASFGDENFGRMVKLAGGHNLGTDILPGAQGMVSGEQIIAANPDVYISTGSNWSQSAKPDGIWVGVGAGADLSAAKVKLAALMDRPAFTGVKAKETGNVHAIWHQFYTNPFQFVAIQQIAKWLHPDLFADLDPEATFRELHERFLPIAYKPGYWVSLND